jgi:hypothetical protein
MQKEKRNYAAKARRVPPRVRTRQGAVRVRGRLIANGFVKSPYNQCSFNKIGVNGTQITVILHIDDFCKSHPNSEKILKYLGVTFKSHICRITVICMPFTLKEHWSYGFFTEQLTISLAYKWLFHRIDASRYPYSALSRATTVFPSGSTNSQKDSLILSIIKCTIAPVDSTSALRKALLISRLGSFPLGTSKSG